MVSSGELRIGGDIEPELMHELNVLRTEARGMWSDRVLTDASIRRINFETQPRTRFRHALPSVAREFRLFVGCQLVRESANHSRGIQARCSHHDGFEDIGRRDYQQRNRLTLLF